MKSSLQTSFVAVSRGSLLTLSLSILGLSILNSGCASHRQNEKIDQQLEKEPAVANMAQLENQVRNDIKISTNLNEDQKTKLLALDDQVSRESTDLRSQSLKLRELLIHEITRKNYDSSEVRAVKARLKKVESQRLSLIFKAVDEANKILGHEQEEENSRIIRDLDFEGHGTETRSSS